MEVPCVICCAQSRATLCDPMDCACQAPLFMEFSRQEYWRELPFPTPGDLPDPGIEPTSLTCPALAAGLFTNSATWEAGGQNNLCINTDLVVTLQPFRTSQCSSDEVHIPHYSLEGLV